MEKSKTSNRYSAEVRSRAVRMVLEQARQHKDAQNPIRGVPRCAPVGKRRATVSLWEGHPEGATFDHVSRRNQLRTYPS
jgi:hypothetical protein